jgi:hypothetical protein
MLLATGLSLVLVPALYVVVQGFAEAVSKRWRGETAALEEEVAR